MHAGEKACGGADVIAGAFPGYGIAGLVASPVSTVRRSLNGARRERRRQLERRAFCGRRPLFHLDAVRHVAMPNRWIGFVSAAAANAGTMPSSSGSATVAPMPRRKGPAGDGLLHHDHGVASLSVVSGFSRRARRPRSADMRI
jgi:hypothetical protein